MANLFAQNTANWDSASMWNTVANGSGSYQTPGASDVCMANGKTATVNINVTVAEVRTDTTGGATTGGGFILSNGVTLTANCYAGSTVCVAYNGTVGNSASIVGNLVGGSSGTSHGANNANTGTLNVTGNSNARGATNSSTGTLNFTGTATGGSSFNANGIENNYSSGTLAITGSVVGGVAGHGAYNGSTGPITISGNATGGKGGHGCYVNSTGAVTISGYAIANNYPNESLAAGTYGLYSNSASNAAVKVGGTKTGTGGYPAVFGRHFFAAGGVQAAYLYDGNAGSAVNLNAVAQSYPNAADVRYGTQYNANSQTGTLRVPAAASVLYGVLVDNTSGTATLAAADIRSAIGLASANLDTQLSTIAGYIDTEVAAIKAKTDNLPADTNTLLTSTGVKVATNADKNGYALTTTPPTAAQIRAEMDANSTKLANLDVAVSTRLAPAGTLATVTTLTNAPDVPTEAEIAAAVWSYVTRTITSGGITAQQVWEYATRTITSGGITAQQVWEYATRTLTSESGSELTAQEVWEYVSTLLPDGAEAMLAGIAARMAEQVPTGPVVVLPAPAAGQTIAWVMCYGPNGALEQGVTISIFLTKTTEDGAFDAAAAVLTSDEDGLAQGPIPRGAGHTFKARRGTNGKLYAFGGVDADTLALPTLLGSP